METKLCRPVLVESKDSTTMIGWKNKIELINNSISQLVDKYYELILISLDPDEKIEVGNNFWYRNYKLMTCTGLSKSGQILTNNEVAKHNDYGHPQSLSKKVIATQSQLSPEYIQQFIEDYNKGEVKDVEIEMIAMNEGYNKPEDYPFQEIDIPKLTNGFVTIAEKSNIEKQADLVEETAFENLKVKKPITYTEEEVLEYLNNLNDLLEEKQYISNINEGIISASNMSSKKINELNKREEYIQSITNDNFKIDVRKWFEQNKKK
jgi:hypothetical protein